jgi:hypothetical protein
MVEPVSPPVEPVSPPVEPVSPPVEPVSPLVEPVPPPVKLVPPPVQGPVPPAPSRNGSFTIIAILAIAVLAVIAGAFMFMQDQSGAPVVTPATITTVPPTTAQQTIVPITTTVPTTTLLATPTPSLPVPQSGVWVRIMYPDNYAGSVGTPGRLKEIDDSGERLYQIPTTDGPVVVSVQKSDGSLAELAVDVYKDGVLIKHAATIAPRGLIEIQTLLQLTTETTIPVTTPA